MLKRAIASVIFCGIAITSTAFGQSPVDAKKRPLPDFDIRDQILSSNVPNTQIQPNTMVDRRKAYLAAFASSPEEMKFGTRIVSNQYGLPKVYLREGHSLSGPSLLKPAEIAKGFLRDRPEIFSLIASDIDRLRLVVNDVTDNGTFISFTQTIDGIDVFNAQIKFTLNKHGEVIQVATSEMVPGLNLQTAPRLSVEEAVQAAFVGIGAGQPGTLSRAPETTGKPAFLNPRGGSYSPITAELSIFPMTASSARLAYRIFLEVDTQAWYEILIDADTGAVLFRHNLYVFSGQARVWTESPSTGSRNLVTLPDGWLPQNGTVTTGNNVDAYVDANGNDAPDATVDPNMREGRAYSPTQLFDFTFGDGTVQMNPRFYQPAAVTNLFYLVNTAHDFYYGLGFNEEAGNFQTDNLGHGGLGNDAVRAEAEFGGFTNNAAFSPTPEGVAPKIRMGLFTRGTSILIDDLDSDYDGQVVLHEYGHGVSNRLVGAKTSTSCLLKIQSGALGEGWSDYFAISFFNNPIHAIYLSQNSSKGIRRYSYEGYPLTYEDVGNGVFGYEVHDDGEIWAGTLWDLRNSLGAAVTDRLVIDGLKSTPCNPSMTDARDAILSADQATHNGDNRPAIWAVFARHGLGYSAAGLDGTLLSGTRYDSSYDLPPDLQSARFPAITSNPLLIHVGAGDLYKYTVAASNPAGGALNFELSKGPADMTLDSATGVISWPTAFIGPRVKITVTDGRGGKVVHGYSLPVLTLLNNGLSATIAGEQFSAGFAAITVPSGVPVLQIALRGGTGDADLFVTDPDGNFVVSFRDGNTETLSLPNPRAGQWRIEVDAYTSYAGVSLTASLITPVPLPLNTSLSGLSGITSSETFYRISLPSGASTFAITTSGGIGDLDLFLRKGFPAVCQPPSDTLTYCLFDYVSGADGNSESITINNPPAGDWYIDLFAYDAYSEVTLNVTTTFPSLTLTSGGSATTSTPGTANAISTGYATASVDSGLAPYGTAVFSLSQNGYIVSEAGVPASPPTQSARIFVDYRTGVAAGIGSLDINTGIAIANRSASTATLTYTLRDQGGQTVAVGNGSLPAGAHRAKFVHELKDIAPDFSLPGNFSTATKYGSLEISSSQPVSVLALRLTTNQRGETLLTSTAVADLATPPTSSEVYFPQLADGGGFTTFVVLSNTSGSTESGTITILDDTGAALSVRPVGGTPGSTFSYSIPAAGTFVFQTDGSPATPNVGWIRVVPSPGSTAPVGAGVFAYSPQGILVTESGIPSAVPTTHARLYVDKSNGHDTGIAIVNPAAGKASSIAVQAFQKDGTTAAGSGPTTLNLTANGHKAAFAGEIVSGLPAGFTGVADLTSTSPFVALTLRSLTNGRGDFLLTTFPVADATQPAPSPIVFPQIADGVGYSTQFIFISASGAASVNVDFVGDDGLPAAIGRTP